MLHINLRKIKDYEMSHCTTFTFQYTDENLMKRAFENLGFDCNYHYIHFYKTNNDIERNMPYATTKAITAVDKGFNFFMKKEQDHYVFVAEKHIMDKIDEIYAQQVEEAFRKEYIKLSVADFVSGLQIKGINARLVEKNESYEVLFGPMYEKSINIEFSDGKITEEVKGIKGKSCVTITETLEDLLSSADVELNSEWTNEYYEKSEDELLVYELVKK